MKKIIAFSLALLLAPLIGGCSSNFEDNYFSFSNQTKTPASTSSKLDIDGLTLIDNVYYARIDDHAEVMGFDSNAKSVVIRNEVLIDGETLTVTGISSNYENEGVVLNDVLEEISIPDSVTFIKKYGLGGLEKVESVAIPNSVNSIEIGAFYRSQFKEISLPSYGSDYGYMDDENNFYSFYESHNYEIEESISRWFGDHYLDVMNLNLAFAGDDCYVSAYEPYYADLWRFTDEPVVERVNITGGDYLFPRSFSELNSIKEIHFSSSIKGAFGHPFGYRTSFNTYFESLEDYLSIKSDTPTSSISYISSNVFIANDKIKDLVIPEGVTEIPSYAFRSFNDLETISLPNSLEKIGYKAFDSVGVKTNYYQGGFYYGNEDNPYVALMYTSSLLEDFSFHYNCRAFTNSSFDNCISTLKRITINEKIKYIPDMTFCTDKDEPRKETILEDIYFSGENNIEEIGYAAFSSTKLKSFSFGERIHIIKEEAFSGCQSLITINWPQSVNQLSIGNRAFGWNESLSENVIIPNGTIRVGDEAFMLNLSKHSTVYIPLSLVDLPLRYDGEIGSIFSLFYLGQEEIYRPTIYLEGTINQSYRVLESLDKLFEYYGFDYLGYDVIENYTLIS